MFINVKLGNIIRISQEVNIWNGMFKDKNATVLKQKKE